MVRAKDGHSMSRRPSPTSDVFPGVANGEHPAARNRAGDVGAHPANAVAVVEAGLAGRRYWRAMAGMVAAAAVLRVAILVEFVLVNPLAEMPWMDGLEYWNIAGRSASGEWAQPTPFLSAPLYPYFLGMLRLLGVDLIGVPIVQLILHLLSAILTGEAVRVGWTRLAGLVAAATFLLLTEPAVVFTRLLSENLQVFLVSLLAWRWIVTAREPQPSWVGIVTCSVLIGLLALAYPPAMLLIPAWAAWLVLANGRTRRGVWQSLLGVSVAALAISPATLHNWLLHGEPIPITAHSGITLRQGNGPEATGIIHSIPGVVARRDTMHVAAAAVFREDHGREGTWREIDGHFRDEVLRYWVAHPLATLRLAGRKAWLFLTARHYGDMLSITIEREIGLCRLALLAPLAVPWIMGAAFVGLFIAFRHPVRYAPFWVLTLLPLVIVMGFFYSPRYRFPVIPPLCGLAAVAVCDLATGRTPRRLGWLLACGLPLLGGIVNEATGIDSPGNQRTHVLNAYSDAQTAIAGRRIAEGRFASAEKRLASAIRICDTNTEAYELLVRLCRQTESPEMAVAPLRRLGQLMPDNIAARKSLYNVLCQIDNLAEAAAVLRDLEQLDGNDVDTQLALAWLEATAPDKRLRNGQAALDRVQRLVAQAGTPTREMLAVRAAAEAECGAFDQAVKSVQHAAAEARRHGQGMLAGSLEQAAKEFAQKRTLWAPPRPLSSPASSHEQVISDDAP